MHDYHIHTSLCKHAEGDMDEYVEAAIEKGITEICFTDHIPFDDGFDSDHRMTPQELDTYLNKIHQCRSKYKEITILTGIEADYLEGYEEYLETFLSKHPFDLVIMSVHFIKKWGDKGWAFSFEYTDDTIQWQYKDYFDAMIKGIETGLFDVIGHFDLIKRIRNPVLDTNRADVDRALDAAKNAGMCVELNTSGWRKYVEETYPAPEILGMAVDKEIPIVLSSDAHNPGQVGYCFEGLLPQLHENFQDMVLASFRQRQVTVHPLIQSGNK